MTNIHQRIVIFLYNHIGLAILLVFVFVSHPFLKIPYDVWDHLIKIRNIYDHGSCYLYWPDDRSYMCLWHIIWAGLFKVLGIDDTLFWARMIHVTQVVLSGGAVYYFCRTVFRILHPDVEKIHLKILSWIAVLLWFTGNGTHSIVHQQAWIMWYSVNYQGFTMPLFWYMTALMLQFFFGRPTKSETIFILLQIFFLSAVISAAHPSEQIYFFIHAIILCIIQYKVLLSFRKRTYIYSAFAIASGIVFYILLFKYQILPMPTTIQDTTWAEIVRKIEWIGFMNVDGRWNRFPNSFSEIAILSISLAIVYRIFIFIKPQGASSRRCFDYLLITSCLFLIIPITRITSGIVGYITFSETVWRFVFASPWFVFLPLIIYRISTSLNKQLSLLIISANMILLIGVFLLSKYVFYQAFYGNIQSLVSSFDINKVGIQYSREDINKLFDIIKSHEKNDVQKERPNLLYIRSDLGIIAKAIYGRDIYMAKIRMPQLTIESFYNQKLDRRYHLIDVDVPASFPIDIEIKNNFNINKPYLSKRRFFDLPEEQENLVYIFDKISQDEEFLKIYGWAFIKGQSSRGQETYVILQSNGKYLIYDAFVDYRPDVSKHFGRRDLDDSGFIASIRKRDIGKDIFRLGLYIKKNDIYGYIFPNDKEKIKID